MKQVLLSFCLALITLSAVKAQVLTLTPATYNATFSNVFLNGDADLESHISITNNSTDTVRLKWTRDIPVACPDGWKSQVCDNSFCFVASASTNYNPPQIEVPFILAPGETFPNFLLHVLPGTSAGCCEIKIHFTTIEDQATVLETATFNVSVNTPDCSVSSTTEPSVIASLRAYPNPSTGYFSISDNPLVKKVVVYNVLGKQVSSFTHTNGKLYDINGTPDGLYLVSMQDAKGETIKTVRITKQDLRP